MQIKVTLGYYFLPTKMTKTKGTDKYPNRYRATIAPKCAKNVKW